MSDSDYWNVYSGLDSDNVGLELMLQFDDDDVDYEDYEDAMAVQAQEAEKSRDNINYPDLQSPSSKQIGSVQINDYNSNNNSKIKMNRNEESILNGRIVILLTCFIVWILLRLIKRWRSRSLQSVDLPNYHVHQHQAKD